MSGATPSSEFPSRETKVKAQVCTVSLNQCGRMAEARVSVNLNEFTCPICLDLLKDPVSVACGHSFCMYCINRQWDGQVHSRVYTCPLCKQRFSPRPILGRNIMLVEMVKKLKKTRVPERTLAGMLCLSVEAIKPIPSQLNGLFNR